MTGLPSTRLRPYDGWCDDPEDSRYNQHVLLPYPGRHERLWREDHRYDIIIVIGYNDDPVRKGKGSAIFLHIAGEIFQPTEGCIAMTQNDILELLTLCTRQTTICIH